MKTNLQNNYDNNKITFFIARDLLEKWRASIKRKGENWLYSFMKETVGNYYEEKFTVWKV